MKPKDYKVLLWAERQAKELLGLHTGGPNETAYREKLRELRTTLKTIKSNIK
jgi:hypothetical protein